MSDQTWVFSVNPRPIASQASTDVHTSPASVSRAVFWQPCTVRGAKPGLLYEADPGSRADSWLNRESKLNFYNLSFYLCTRYSFFTVRGILTQRMGFIALHNVTASK